VIINSDITNPSPTLGPLAYAPVELSTVNAAVVERTTPTQTAPLLHQHRMGLELQNTLVAP
jgi:hypothetical protein